MTGGFRFLYGSASGLDVESQSRFELRFRFSIPLHVPIQPHGLRLKERVCNSLQTRSLESRVIPDFTPSSSSVSHEYNAPTSKPIRPYFDLPKSLSRSYGSDRHETDERRIYRSTAFHVVAQATRAEANCRADATTSSKFVPPSIEERALFRRSLPFAHFGRLCNRLRPFPDHRSAARRLDRLQIFRNRRQPDRSSQRVEPLRIFDRPEPQGPSSPLVSITNVRQISLYTPHQKPLFQTVGSPSPIPSNAQIAHASSKPLCLHSRFTLRQYPSKLGCTLLTKNSVPSQPPRQSTSNTPITGNIPSISKKRKTD